MSSVFYFYLIKTLSIILNKNRESWQPCLIQCFFCLVCHQIQLFLGWGLLLLLPVFWGFDQKCLLKFNKGLYCTNCNDHGFLFLKYVAAAETYHFVAVLPSLHFGNEIGLVMIYDLNVLLNLFAELLLRTFKAIYIKYIS